MKRTTKTYNQLYPCSLSGDHYQLNQMYTQPTIQQKYILYIKKIKKLWLREQTS